MKKLKLFALAAMALIGFSGIAIAADATMLMQDDFVGISFWVISMGMLAATAFFFMEAGNVASGWRTSVIVSVNSWRVSSSNPYFSHVHVVYECNTSY